MWHDYDLPDITKVETVSDLRYYINCTEDYNGLKKKFKCSYDKIEYIYNHLKGQINVMEILEHFTEYKENIKERETSKAQAEQKNRELQQQLEKSRDNFCGIGTRKAKLFLNKKIKEGDIIAKLYRTALEIEDKNITAKKIMNKYHGYGYEYADKVYAEKHKLIRELVGLCIDNDIIYGYQVCDDISTNAIIYFELPNMEQISFHDSMSKEELEKWKIYTEEWNGKKNSTLRKIENSILTKYKEALI